MRKIQFRAWNHTDEKMIYPEQYESAYQQETPFCKVRGIQDFWFMSLSHEWELMQFTGLLDKNSLTEVYEGDIIDETGKVKGNIYESPQIYKEGIDCVIEGMGTKTWRNTESIAMGRGCKYAK